MNNKYQEALDNMYDNYVYGAKQKEDSYFTLQELVDKVPYYEELEAKATPKKPLNIKQDESTFGNTIGDCHSCKNLVIGDCYEYKEKFCRECGQAIDWSKDE